MSIDKQALQANIQRMEQELADMKAKLNEKEQWHPKGGDWTLSEQGAYQAKTIKEYKQAGVEFSTEQAALKAFKAYRKYHRLYKLAEELNCGWEMEWKETNKAVYSIIWDSADNEYSIDYTRRYDRFIPVFKDEATAEKPLSLLQKIMLC